MFSSAPLDSPSLQRQRRSSSPGLRPGVHAALAVPLAAHVSSSQLQIFFLLKGTDPSQILHGVILDSTTVQSSQHQKIRIFL